MVYSVKRIIDPGFNSEQISFFSTIKDAKKVDDLTVQIITDGPDPILPWRLYWMKMVPPSIPRTRSSPRRRSVPAPTSS